MDHDATRREVAETCRRLARLGLVSGTAGNVSVRVGGGMLITPTGGAFEEMTPEALVRTALDGAASDGVPSSEWEMHAEIYRAHPGCGAVVHAHPDHCVALSCLRRPIPPFHYMIAAFGGNDVPCAPYLPFGSSELARATAEALKERTACLLGSHGMTARGATLAAAAKLAVELETVARHYLLALQAGEPVLLSDTEMAEAHRRFRHYGRERIPAAEG